MIVYDTGALVAGERGARALGALHAAALRDRVSPLVPAGVLAQAWRGGPQPNLSRLLAGCTVVPLDERLARAAGALCGIAGTGDVTDASVVVVARMSGGAIVTGDVADVRHLAESAGADLVVHAV